MKFLYIAEELLSKLNLLLGNLAVLIIILTTISIYRCFRRKTTKPHLQEGICLSNINSLALSPSKFNVEQETLRPNQSGTLLILLM